MSDFENRLSAMLKDAVDEPRRPLDPADVLATRSGRGRTVALVALAAAVVVAVTLGVSLGPDRHDAARPGPHPVSPDISTSVPPPTPKTTALYGRTWIVDRLHERPGAQSISADAPVPFMFSPADTAGLSSIGIGKCGSNTARIRARHMTFVQGLVTTTPTDCGPDLGVAQGRFVFSVLAGRVTWAISGHELTITHPGVGSVAFTDTAPKGTVQMQLHLDRTTAAANGQPITGYVTVFNETGARITLADATCDGWIGVGLINSRVSYGLLDGDVLCASNYLPTGTSRTPIKIQTTYQGCSPHGGKYNRALSSPPCIGAHHQTIPPLPPGRYETRVETQNVSPTIPAPAPMAVTLTKP